MKQDFITAIAILFLLDVDIVTILRLVQTAYARQSPED